MGSLISNTPDEDHALCGVFKWTKAWSIRLGAQLCREHAWGKKKSETLLPVVFTSRLTLQMFKNCCQNLWNEKMKTGTDFWVPVPWVHLLSWWMETDWKESQWKFGECFVPSVSGTFLSFFVTSIKPKKGKCAKAQWWYSWSCERFESLYCCTWLSILFHHSLATLVFQPQTQNEKPLNSFQDLGTL